MSIMAELFWYEQLSEDAQAKVREDAKNQNTFHPDAYLKSMFYRDGKMYSHKCDRTGSN